MGSGGVYMEYIVLMMIVLPLVLFLILKPAMADRKVRNNVNNSDLFAQHYCFVLDCNQTDALDKLSLRNVNDNLKYTLNKDWLTIVFSHFGTSVKYQLSFYVVENKTYLKVSRAQFLYKSNIPLMINRFFIEKIGAVPVDYSYFESSICTALSNSKKEKSALRKFLDILVSKSTVIIVAYALFAAVLWTLFLLFGDDPEKTKILILAPVIAAVIYGFIRLLFFIFKKNPMAPDIYIDLISIVFLAMSALTLGTILMNFIVLFPNGFSPIIGAELGLVSGILHANKNRT